MTTLFTARTVRYTTVALLVLAASAGCAGQAAGGTDPNTGAPPATNPPATNPPSTNSPGTDPPDATPTPKPAATSKRPPTWPNPADCVSYNPTALTQRYEAGYYTVSDGATVVLRVPGQPGDTTGAKALALAQRYQRHCFLGRTNNREEHNSYIFDYWRDPSGATPTIPEQDEDCSPYDRSNLTVEDMGGGYGWRVKDHDHVLHLFDTESDARNGKLVLAKYRQICFIGVADGDDPDQVSYSL